MQAISKLLDTLFDKMFGRAKSKIEEKEIPEIQCSPTFWRFLDEKKQLILDWDMSETIQLVDNEKLNKLRREHIRLKYPDKSRIEIAVGLTLEDIQPVMSHIIEEHFDEIKLDIPSNVVASIANSTAIVSGIKNILTGESFVFSMSKCVIAEDMVIYSIRTIEWDIIDEILKKEPAICKQKKS